jgi:hypothetical protein
MMRVNQVSPIFPISSYRIRDCPREAIPWLFIIDREELSLSFATSLGSFNECLETIQLVIGAPSKSRSVSEKDTQTISYSEANREREIIITEKMIIPE